MPSFIKNSVFNDIKPKQSGGIININDGNISFQYNFVSNIISSTTASCFYSYKSIISIENSCFTRCTAAHGNSVFGNVGEMSTSTVKLNDISAYLCSFSAEKCGDSVFRFIYCGTSIANYNSSFCICNVGSPAYRSDSNTSEISIRFIACLSGVGYAFIENHHTALYEKCIFINSTQVSNTMINTYQNSIFNSCYFFSMTTKTKFSSKVILKNCFSDELISEYSLTTYSSGNDCVLPIINKPNCSVRRQITCRRTTQRNNSYLCIVLVLLS